MLKIKLLLTWVRKSGFTGHSEIEKVTEENLNTTAEFQANNEHKLVAFQITTFKCVDSFHRLFASGELGRASYLLIWRFDIIVIE